MYARNGVYRLYEDDDNIDAYAEIMRQFRARLNNGLVRPSIRDNPILGDLGLGDDDLDFRRRGVQDLSYSEYRTPRPQSYNIARDKNFTAWLGCSLNGSQSYIKQNALEMHLAATLGACFPNNTAPTSGGGTRASGSDEIRKQEASAERRKCRRMVPKKTRSTETKHRSCRRRAPKDGGQTSTEAASSIGE